MTMHPTELPDPPDHKGVPLEPSVDEGFHPLVRPFKKLKTALALSKKKLQSLQGAHKNPKVSPTNEPGLYEDGTLQQVHTQMRVKKEDEPAEGLAPIPLFLIFLFAGMMFWSGFYLSRYSGDFRSDVFYPEWRPNEVAQAAAPIDPLKQGKKLFTNNCQQCHQSTGQGVPGVYPPLAGSEWVLGDDNRIAKLLLAGMSGTVTIKGQMVNGNMPSFNHWKDRDIAAVLSYVRQEWGNKAAEVLEETVKKARDTMGNRTKPWKPEELLKENPF